MTLFSHQNAGEYATVSSRCSHKCFGLRCSKSFSLIFLFALFLFIFFLLSTSFSNTYAQSAESNNQELQLGNATLITNSNVTIDLDTPQQEQLINPALLGAILTASVGVGGLLWGILTYKQGQTVKRQEILSPLVCELENSEKMFIAKAILDGFSCNVPELISKDTNTLQLLKDFIKKETTTPKEEDPAVFHKKKLSRTLRDHTKEEVSDHHEIVVRASFDALISFFVKLEYLKDIGLLKEKELAYFYYYYYLLDENDDVKRYISIYGLGLNFSFRCLKSYKRYSREREKNDAKVS